MQRYINYNSRLSISKNTPECYLNSTPSFIYIPSSILFQKPDLFACTFDNEMTRLVIHHHQHSFWYILYIVYYVYCIQCYNLFYVQRDFIDYYFDMTITYLLCACSNNLCDFFYNRIVFPAISMNGKQ